MPGNIYKWLKTAELQQPNTKPKLLSCPTNCFCCCLFVSLTSSESLFLIKLINELFNPKQTRLKRPVPTKPSRVGNGNGNGIYIPHFLYVYIQMRFTPNP